MSALDLVAGVGTILVGVVLGFAVVVSLKGHGLRR